MIICLFCHQEFDPIRTRWLCPHCTHKANCCEGQPLPPVKGDPPDAA